MAIPMPIYISEDLRDAINKEVRGAISDDDNFNQLATFFGVEKEEIEGWFSTDEENIKGEKKIEKDKDGKEIVFQIPRKEYEEDQDKPEEEREYILVRGQGKKDVNYYNEFTEDDARDFLDEQSASHVIRSAENYFHKRFRDSKYINDEGKEVRLSRLDNAMNAIKSDIFWIGGRAETRSFLNDYFPQYLVRVKRYIREGYNLFPEEYVGTSYRNWQAFWDNNQDNKLFYYRVLAGFLLCPNVVTGNFSGQDKEGVWQIPTHPNDNSEMNEGDEGHETDRRNNYKPVSVSSWFIEHKTFDNQGNINYSTTISSWMERMGEMVRGNTFRTPYEKKYWFKMESFEDNAQENIMVSRIWFYKSASPTKKEIKKQVRKLEHELEEDDIL